MAESPIFSDLSARGEYGEVGEGRNRKGKWSGNGGVFVSVLGHPCLLRTTSRNSAIYRYRDEYRYRRNSSEERISTGCTARRPYDVPLVRDERADNLSSIRPTSLFASLIDIDLNECNIQIDGRRE